VGGIVDQSRRDFLKKGAAAGTVVWAAPTIATLSASPAWAQGTPCPCEGCRAQATAINVFGGTSTVVANGCTCEIPIDIPPGGTPGVEANVACAKADDATCSASSFIEGAEVRLSADTALRVSTLSSCVSCGTGDSLIAGVVLVTAGVETPIDVTDGCNEPITIGPLVEAVFNEQLCENGVLTVRALRLTLLGQGTIILGESKAGAEGCPCEPCSASPACTPPTVRLC
jgi:hypothetical protein